MYGVQTTIERREQVTEDLVQFWQRMDALVGPMFHPEDQVVLSDYAHTFNLEYPPAPYIGDVGNAPVIILNGNCVYNPGITPAEFRTRDSALRALDHLHNPKPIDPTSISQYFTGRDYSSLIESGVVAEVYAFPYRSMMISSEPRNQRVGKLLASHQFHKFWLREFILPMAEDGDRLVIANRNALWGIKRKDRIGGVFFSKAARSINIGPEALNTIDAFLGARPVFRSPPGHAHKSCVVAVANER